MKVHDLGTLKVHDLGKLKVHDLKKCVGSKIGVISSTKNFDMSGCHKVEAISSSGNFKLHSMGPHVGHVHNAAWGTANIRGNAGVGSVHNHGTTNIGLII